MKKSRALAVLEYLLFICISRIIFILPRKFIFLIADLLGSAAVRLPGRKTVAMKNLDIAYGDSLSRGEKEKIVEACFQGFIKNLFDFLKLSRLDKELIKNDLVTVEGLDIVEKAFQKGKGVILLGFHYGNWELIPLVHSMSGLPPVNIITRRLDNPYIEKDLFTLRRSTGNDFIHKDKAARAILSSLKKNHAVGILLDQNTAVGGVFVDFFTTPAATSKAIGTFAVATGAAILPTVCLPQPDMTYRITYGPELDYKITGDKYEDMLSITRDCTAFIESTIKKHPEFWLWGHKRWKTRPEGEAGLY